MSRVLMAYYPNGDHTQIERSNLEHYRRNGYEVRELDPDDTSDVSGRVVLKANPSLWPFPEPPSVPDGDMYNGIVNAPPISKVKYE